MPIYGLGPLGPAKPAHFDLEKVIRPNILALHPYRCARDDYKEGVLLDANENALGHSIGETGQIAPEVQGALSANLHRYPDPSFDEIKGRIARLRGLPDVKHVFLGVGSDEVIDLLMRVCVAPGREKILITPPTYGMYAVSAQVNDVGVVRCPLELSGAHGEGGERGRFSLRVDAVKDAVAKDPLIKLIFLCSPGNPTGTTITLGAMRALLEYEAFKGIVVVDEAYIDFAGAGASAVSLIESYGNLCVMQTLSKSFGLAAIRLGVALAQPGLIQVLSNTKAPYNISGPTAGLALAALETEAIAGMRAKVRTLVASRERLRAALEGTGVFGASIGGQEANFVLIPVVDGAGAADNVRAQAVYKTLAETHGVVVRFRGGEAGACLYSATMTTRALLPPGLVNHGNTCFMNSVLQGLIATDALRDAPPGPIADTLLALLRAARAAPPAPARPLSPRDLLAALGTKYDQYLDFRQQDAHEFLGHLLDAVRIEHQDRSPPRSPRTRTRHPDALDTLFGGTLASILVCQACKHVSVTHEHFADLSLPIKPEDYARGRKRDRLRQFAKRIFYPQPRSSSVPATPVRDTFDGPDSPRRRSIDVLEPPHATPPPPSPSAPTTPTDTPPDPARLNGKRDESWANIGRRISVSVGLAKRPKKIPDTPDEKDALNEKLVTTVKPPAPRFPLISRPASPAGHPKPKPPRPPKLASEEAAYLRDILADVNPPHIPKPFSIFKPSKDPSSQHIFLKLNQISRIEECLRLFTSVEVLDGDNTVRCHRCWKIANGFYKPRPRRSAQEPDSCSDTDDDNEGPKPLTASPSHSSTSLPPPHKPVPPALQLNDEYPIELVSPVRDATPTQFALAAPAPPGSPLSVDTARPPRGDSIASTWTRASSSYPRASLGAPEHPDDISGSESETLLSLYSDVSSAASSNASQDQLAHPAASAPSSSAASSTRKAHPSGVPRARQYVPRPAYKRYLIATPPPILVVHLKRFQQLSKTPVVSFSTGFKKLDDYIAFPEFLDLAPYLAPKREDYFETRLAVTRGRSKRPAPCMYRLYAVVVHIGNMLGGHYVAYTAIRPPSSDADTRPEGDKQTRRGKGHRDWAFISDTIVRLTSLEEVLKTKAYMCMYERI